MFIKRKTSSSSPSDFKFVPSKGKKPRLLDKNSIECFESNSTNKKDSIDYIGDGSNSKTLIVNETILNLKFEEKSTSCHCDNSPRLATSRGCRLVKLEGQMMNSFMCDDTNKNEPEVCPPLTQLWKYDTGKCVDASPLVMDLG